MIHHMYPSTLLVYFMKSYHINAQISLLSIRCNIVIVSKKITTDFGLVSISKIVASDSLMESS